MRSLRTAPRLLGVLQDGVGLLDVRAVFVEQRFFPRRDLLYGASFAGDAIHISDWTDPRDPQFQSNLVDHTQLRFANGVWAGRWGPKHYCLVACGGEVGDFESRLTAVDVTDPTAPFVASTLVDTTALGGARKVRVHDNVAFVAGQRGDVLGLVDVTDPLDMSVLGHFTASWLDIFHAAEPYVVDGRVLAFCVSAGSQSSFGIIDCTDPTAPFEVAHIFDQPSFDGSAGVSVVERDGRRFAIVAVANNDGMVVIDCTDVENPEIIVPNHRDEIRTGSPQHIDVTPDGNWAYVASQNQTPLPGGFDGAVSVFDLRELPRLRWVTNVQYARTEWRTVRHIHCYSSTRSAIGFRSGNGAGVIENPSAAPRYLANLRDPSDWPTDRDNDWNAATQNYAAGDAMDSWENDANPANPLVQGSSSLRPIFRRLQAGGRPAAEFDGADDRMITTDTAQASYQRPRTIATVVSFDAVLQDGNPTLSVPRILASGVVNVAVTWALTARNPQGTFNTVQFFGNAGSVSAQAVLPLGTPLVVILVISGTTARVVVGGYADASGTVGTHVPQGYSLGAIANGNSPLNGLVYRVTDWASDDVDLNHIGRHARVAYGSPWADVA